MLVNMHRIKHAITVEGTAVNISSNKSLCCAFLYLFVQFNWICMS